MKNSPYPLWINFKKNLSEFQNSLLDWYDHHRRDLPWRLEPSLYKTVVSEFMLQQTRVSTVLPYFENWLNQFPNFHTLSCAHETKVLKAWEGLGYYSRVRNLHKLAKVAALWQYPPQTVEEWKKLPGVGPYIAAAVTSISLGKAEAVCDGNVVRVLSRIFEVSERFKDGATAQKKIHPIAQSVVSKKRPGDYNQAMMELGATICHRLSPQCSKCPILKHCQSGIKGDWNKYPVIIRKQKKTASLRRYWIENKDRILLYSPDRGRLHGVFELPQKIPTYSDSDHLNSTILATHKRTIGTVQYTEDIHWVKLIHDLPTELPKGYLWMKWSEMDTFTISAPHRKWMSEIKKLTISK